MKFIVFFLIAILIVVPAITDSSFAHRSGCHRWHSCPSDTGSYECGDLGYDTYCPKKIKDTQSGSSSSSSSGSTSQSKKSPECKGTASCLVGTVVKIIDGDTLVVNRDSIRLSLVNTPEKGEDGFKEATAFTKKLCPLGSTVTIDQDDKQKKDQFGRILGKVYCSGKILNAELLYAGHAQILKKFCKKSEFASEDWAKKYGC